MDPAHLYRHPERCGGPNYCPDCAMRDYSADFPTSHAAELVAAHHATAAALARLDRYTAVLASIANLGDADCTSPGVAAMRAHCRAVLATA